MKMHGTLTNNQRYTKYLNQIKPIHRLLRMLNSLEYIKIHGPKIKQWRHMSRTYSKVINVTNIKNYNLEDQKCKVKEVHCKHCHRSGQIINLKIIQERQE